MKQLLLLVVLTGLWLFFRVCPCIAEEASWDTLERGLEYALFPLEENVLTSSPQTAPALVALRFDPRYFSFRLYCAGERNSPPKTLETWAREHSLVAAINAGMYLPDGLTNTGYMRSGEYINNPRITRLFGAFFVAGPRREGLRPVALLDRDADNWEELLSQYDTVIQNYRMLTPHHEPLWSPGGPRYAISAVGQDYQGHILFLHCREPINAYTFTVILMSLNLHLRTLMYVEGGSQAGLLMHTARISRTWQGRPRGTFWSTESKAALLPNVLGVLRKNFSDKEK